ncbi:MAG: EAL domain-containing protein [Spirochaetes bacterium]|nr:EAL domain-containing protein [Spirochaetota bacterium]
MAGFPKLYITLTMLFAGISLCSMLQFVYVYAVLRKRDVILSLVVSCAVLIYLTADLVALYCSYFCPRRAADFFLAFREIFVLVFPVVLQAYIMRIKGQGALLEKINSILLSAAVGAFLLIAGITLYNPDLLIRGLSGSGEVFYQMQIHGESMGPLLVIKNIMLIIYAVYSIFIVMIFGMSRQDVYPARYMIAGIIIITYFISFYVYYIIFPSGSRGSVIGLPLFNLGLVICILFINWGRIKMIIERSEQLEIEKSVLEFSIYNDVSLNIPGRIAFQKDLADELISIGARGESLFVVFFDVDDFQSLNESYGENVGDDVLKMLVERIIELFSPQSSLYRIGGDEFALMLWDAAEIEQARDTAGKIITCLRNPFRVSGITCMITASAGVLSLPHDGSDVDTVLSNAYRVISSAKKKKNSFQVFTPDLLDITKGKIHVVNILRNSIIKNEFTLHYQPIVDSNKNLVHAEALLRYMGSDTHIGSPEKYLPVLENAGLMKEIDNMVVHKAFHDMEVKIKSRFSTSINLSTGQLVDPAYSSFLSSFAAQHGIENRRIMLEVTEDRLMENIAEGRENLARLKESGFMIAIDDFGKGFSSLTYLAELPADILKLDMVFTRSVPGDSRKEAMVHHIIELAHSLDLRVIAEGFETLEQFEFFRNLGCDLFQGYYFARPMPLDLLITKYL